MQQTQSNRKTTRFIPREEHFIHWNHALRSALAWKTIPSKAHLYMDQETTQDETKDLYREQGFRLTRIQNEKFNFHYLFKLFHDLYYVLFFSDIMI